MAGMKKYLTNEKIRKYKMTRREIFEKYDNLSKNELNKKATKEFASKIKLWLLL